jgi:general secretion pathway protein M
MSLQKTLTSFWAARAQRERQILLGGGVVLALVLLYLILIAPAASGVASLQHLLPQTRARAANLEALVAEAKGLRSLPKAAALGAGDARATLEKSLDAAGLKAAHSEPLPNGDLRVTLVNVPYGKWTSWLASTERTMGVHAVAAKIKASAAGGTAKSAGSAGYADIELTLHLPRAG